MKATTENGYNDNVNCNYDKEDDDEGEHDDHDHKDTDDDPNAVDGVNNGSFTSVSGRVKHSKHGADPIAQNHAHGNATKKHNKFL